VGLDCDTAVLIDLFEQLPQRRDEIRGLADGLDDIDLALPEHGFCRLAGGGLIEQLPRLGLGLFDIGLVEGSDADAVAGDGGGILPEQEQLAQTARYGGLEARGGAETRVVGAGPSTHSRASARASEKPMSAGESTTTGRIPCPSLPSDSAMSCSIQAAMPRSPASVSVSTSLSVVRA